MLDKINQNGGFEIHISRTSGKTKQTSEAATGGVL